MEYKEIKVYYFNDLNHEVTIRIVHGDPLIDNEFSVLGPNSGKMFLVVAKKDSLPLIKNWGNVVMISAMEEGHV